MRRHYLDHASTSPPRPGVADAMTGWAAGPVADPGRLHLEGRTVRSVLEEARASIAELLEVAPRQVVLTSGGTEAVNAAVWGATTARPGAPVVLADVEHSSVRDASRRSAPTRVVPVDRHGRLELDRVAAELDGDPPPALVHCQWANHEVGTTQPVAEVVALCRSRGVPVHVDAAAACGQCELGLADLDADLVSVSAHKLGGPPGVGALVVRRGLRLAPLLVGGSQERARRAGMENVPGALGFAAAAAALGGGDRRHLRDGADRAARQVASLTAAALAVGGVHVVGDPDPAGRVPHIVCLAVDGVEAEAVLLGLDRAGVAAHSGSACSSESFEPSPDLGAMGADPGGSLRLSVGWSTTDDDLAAFAEAFPPVVAELRSLR
ncbi:MAG: cysteine desulfurase family protein [Acidimicrobiales bacterium]